MVTNIYWVGWGSSRISSQISSHRRTYPRYLVYVVAFFVTLWTFDYLLKLRHRPTAEVPWTPPSAWNDRASEVRDSFLHAYHGYEAYAAPFDELKPVSNKPINIFNGWGLTAIDSLDTMLLMGLDAEFKRGVALVENANFTQHDNPSVPFFETVIRYLGGLLSAYALSREPVLLTRANELANLLDPIFYTGSGLPAYSVNLRTGQNSRSGFGILAEIGSFQVEYAYLAKSTGNKTHFDRARNAMERLTQADARSTGGLLPVGWNLTSGQPYDTRLSVGSEADSAHEYLLKYYLLTGQTDKTSLELYIRATTYILTHLLFITPHRHLLYVTTTYGLPPQPTHRFEHLSCFLPGLLALGAHTLPLDHLSSLGIDLVKLSEGMDEDTARSYKTLADYDLRQLHLWAAEGLAETCYLTYADQTSGVGPDELSMSSGNGGGEWIEAVEGWKKSGARGVPPGLGRKAAVRLDVQTQNTTEGARETQSAQRIVRDYVVTRPDYLLRPETVESLYLLWRITGDNRWREYGWEIYQAIESQTKTSSGYSCVSRVDTSPPRQLDEMPSYFLAETLKYLYLLFSEDDLVPLDKWVFNTEAHPLPIFKWSTKEREAFGI